MKVALVGSSGYIAKYIMDKLYLNDKICSVLKIDKTNDADVYFDLLKPNELNYDILNDIDIVIFTAAISGPDMCANEFELCWKVNVEGTSVFIDEALKRECNILFFSSDAVFGDIPSMIYDENSNTDANTPYGKMKKFIEDKYKDNKMFKAIRLSYVASAHDRFMSYCMNCVEEDRTADIFHPFYRNAIVVSDVVKVVEWFIFHFNEYQYGVLNVAGNELVSRIRMADELNRIIDYKLKYTVTQPDEEFFNNRPKITQMKSLYLQEYKILDNDTFTEKIKRELKEIKND